MSLIKFRYLHRRRIVSVVAILTLISTLFSVTAYSFLGFYNGFTNYVGEDKDIIAIYSKTSSTPYSGIISLKVTDLVTAQEGVISTSPEVIAPCTINNQSVFIRGIIPDDLKKLNPLQLQYGQDLNLTDTNSCILGINLANKLDLKTGDNLLVFGIASKRYVELQVKGIFNSETSLNDEALVPIYIAQWLRGLNYNDATLIRAKINPQQTNTNQIYQQIINQTQTDQSTTPTPTPKNQTQKQLEALIPMAAQNKPKNRHRRHRAISTIHAKLPGPLWNKQRHPNHIIYSCASACQRNSHLSYNLICQTALLRHWNPTLYRCLKQKNQNRPNLTNGNLGTYRHYLGHLNQRHLYHRIPTIRLPTSHISYHKLPA